MTAPFAVNDKVVRVGGNATRHVNRSFPSGKGPKKGEVHCVTDCWLDPGLGKYLLRLAGFPEWEHPSGDKMGWPASAFRKVEEVGLPAVERESVTAA